MADAGRPAWAADAGSKRDQQRKLAGLSSALRQQLAGSPYRVDQQTTPSKQHSGQLQHHGVAAPAMGANRVLWPPADQQHGQSSPPFQPGQQHQPRLPNTPQGPASPGTQGQLYSIQQQGSPLTSLPPIKGTLRGKYKGHASEQWQAARVQEELDDLGRAVDAFAVVREGRLAGTAQAGLASENQALRTRVGSLQSEVARLQLLLPDDKGEYSTLKRELLELEKECDEYYRQFAEQEAARRAAEAALQQATGRLKGQGGGDPRGIGPEAGAGAGEVVITMGDAAAAAAGGAGGGPGAAGGQLPGGSQPPPLVTPEAVLAAVAFLRDKKELPPSMSGRYPDVRGVFIRLGIVLVVLGAIAGAILATYFLTRQFS